MKILIAEDNPVSRALLKEILLSVAGWDVKEAEDGKQAWDILTGGYGAHILISDIQMPNWTGLDLVRNVRQDDRFKDMPVMLVSSVREKETIVEAASLHISAYVLKPFSAEKVIVQVKQIEENLPATARQLVLEEPEKVMKNLTLSKEKYIEMLDKWVADVEVGIYEVKGFILKGQRNKARTRLDNMQGSGMSFGAGYLIEAIGQNIGWISDPLQFRDIAGLQDEVQRLKNAREEIVAKLTGYAPGGATKKINDHVPPPGMRWVAENPSAAVAKVLRDPVEIMENLRVDAYHYLELLDLSLKDFQRWNEELKTLVLKGDRETARTRLEAMKGGALTFGADRYLEAILHTMAWISNVSSFGEVDILEVELEVLQDARTGLKLILKPLNGVALTLEPSPAQPILPPSPSPQPTPTMHTPPPAPPQPPAPPAAPISPPTPPVQVPVQSVRPTFAKVEEFSPYIPPADVERLKWILSVGANFGYDLTPWQAIRLSLRLAQTMSYTPQSYYELLMEDYKAQGG